MPVDDVFGVACPSATQCAMVGTKWVGFPAVATGAVAQSVNGGVTFRASTAAYTPISLTALSCADELELRRGRRGHRGPPDPPHTQTGPQGVRAARVIAALARRGATAVTKSAADRQKG